MPRIRCHYDDCIFLEEGHCGAAAVELEPDSGCLTYTRVDEADEEEEWEEDEFEDEFDEEEDDLYDDEDDDWDDEDDDL